MTTIVTTSTSTIPYTNKQTNGFRRDREIQLLFPLPLTPTEYHTIEKLERRHKILKLLNEAQLADVARSYHKCHHPDHVFVLACENHPEIDPIIRPNSCGKTTICGECARKHHRFEADRWTDAITQAKIKEREWFKNYHITMTTGHKLSEQSDQHVRAIMKHVPVVIRRYFASLAKAARYHYAITDTGNDMPPRTKTARINAFKADKHAIALYNDLNRPNPPYWWRMMRRRIASGETLKQLGIGALYASEYGEKSQHLHAHGLYSGVPLNYTVYQRIWQETSGFPGVHFSVKDTAKQAIEEVTKYATKLTKCPIDQIVNLYRAFVGQRRIRAIGAFHGLVGEVETEEPEPILCVVCGCRYVSFPKWEYEHLIFLKTGDKSGDSGGFSHMPNAPPLPRQLPLL